MYKHLNKDEISVSLVHGYKDQTETDVFEEHIYLSDLEKLNVFTGTKFFLKAKKWAKKNAERFDVLHCLSAFHSSFLLAVWFEKKGIPSVIKISESKYTGFNESSMVSNVLGLKKYRLKHSNLISGYVSISSEIKNNLINAGIEQKKIHEIPNGVNINRFKPVSKRKKIALQNKLGLDNKFTVLFTGSFSDRKNPYLTAKAFQYYSNSDKIQLLLVGPDRDGGKQRRLIQNFIQANSISNIILIDFVKEIEEYYQASDIFILPSNQEGLSNSMLEAQACGLPAVVTSISGAVDLIDENENGIFIERDTESIKNAIHAYFTDSEKLRNHSSAARKKIADNYSNEKILNDYIQLFERLKR